MLNTRSSNWKRTKNRKRKNGIFDGTKTEKRYFMETKTGTENKLFNFY